MALGSITDELLSAVGGNIPDSVRKAIEKEVEGRLLKLYAQQLKKQAPKIKTLGRKVGSQIASGIMGALIVKPEDVKEATSGGPAWLNQLVMPVVTPFIEGVKETAMPTVTKVAFTLGAVLIGVGAAGGYFVGKRKSVSSPAPRQIT
jgi:hypothetical protein